MRRILLLAAALAAFAALPAQAQTTDSYTQTFDVCRDSITVTIVSASNSAPTLIESPQLTGSRAVEVQNLDSTSEICCSFQSAFTTATTNTGVGCRRVMHNFGTWSIGKWWQNLKVYCQSLGSGSIAVALTSCK